MKRKFNFTTKYMLLAVVLIAMIALSGCRTRITNNSEVSNIKYDEDGFLSETYQMRRDELGLSIAEKPLLPDLGTPEEDIEESEPTEDFNYTPEEPEPYVEPPTTTEAANQANNNSRTSRTSRTTVDDNDEDEISIFYDANKGTVEGEEVISKTYTKGSMITSTPQPIRDGYDRFYGWYTEDGKKIVPPFKAEEDMFLYANWGDVTITFDANGGKISGQDTLVKDMKPGSKLEFPKLTPPPLKGVKFDGWHTDKEKDSPVKETKATKNSVYYAHWKTEEKVVIVLDANGGKIDGKNTATKKPEADGTFGALPSAEKVKWDGHTFKGWSTTPNGPADIEATTKVPAGTDGTVTIYAVWEEVKPTPDPTPQPDPEPEPDPDPETKEYKVTFIDGQGNTLKEESVKKGEAATPPKDPTRDGYNFLGWDKDFSKIESDLIVTAQWEKIKKQITLDGKGKIDTTIVSVEGDTFTLTTVKDVRGFKFDGWLGENEKKYNPGEIVSVDENSTYYAQWRDESPDYWNAEFTSKQKEASEKTYTLYKGTEETKERYGGDDTTIVQECKAKNAAEGVSPDYIISFAKEETDAAAIINEIRNSEIEEYKTKPIIVISDKTNKSSGNTQILYKIALLNLLHGYQLNETDAAEDLDLQFTDIYLQKNIVNPE